MQIAVLSDIHDNVWKLAEALQRLQNADAMICCGDYCSPFVVAQLAGGFSGPIHLVFGNNDADLFRITSIDGGHDHVHTHGELFEGEFDGKRLAANHYNNIALRIAGSGEYDVVCYGHDHIFKIERIGESLTINPGPIMGYNPGRREDVPSTFVIYDSETDTATRYEV